jgi:ComF family protein
MNFKNAALGAFSRAFRFFLELQCINCATNLTSSETYLCNECSEKFYFIDNPKCIRCSKPFYVETELDYVCGECDKRKPSIDRVLCLVSYEGTGKNLIQKFKYGKNYSIGKCIGKLMGKEELSFPIDKIDYIIPVPMTKKKLRMRGFNQSLVLSRLLSQKYSISLAQSLIKKHETLPQVGLTKKDREHNEIEDSLLVTKSSQFLKKNILLIDDVYTTGRTLNSCARILKRAGAKRIYGYVFARTVG